MKPARTTDEMRFAAALEPCPSCGSTELGPIDLEGAGAVWRGTAACKQCGASRSFQFMATGNPATARAGRFELGPGRSELISPEQFLAMLDRCVPKIPDQAPPVGTDEYEAASSSLTKALASVTELLKIVPHGPAATGADSRLTRPWLEKEYLRLKKLVSRYTPPSTIDQAALDAHVAWLRAGGKGPGYLTIEKKKLVGEWYGNIDLTFARIADSDLTNVNLGYAVLDEADLENVTFTSAILDGASMTNATVKGGHWTRSRMSLVKLNAATVTGTDFTGSDLDRSTWLGAKVTNARFDGVRFGNATFDDAVFEGCSFRDASFVEFASGGAPTSAGARFVDCDLSNTAWDKRDLRKTTFIRCKFAGAHGKPAATDGLVLDACDVDLAGLLQRLG